MAVGLAGCGRPPPASPAPGTPGTGPTGTGGEVFTKQQIDPLLADIMKKTPKELPITRLADGLIPPTNRWFSGLAFGDEALPVFPMPLSFGLTDAGFAFGLPTMTTSEKAIIGGYKPEIGHGVRGEEGAGQRVRHPDRHLDHLDADDKLIGKTTIVQGSPYVRFTAETATEITARCPTRRPVTSGRRWPARPRYGLVVTDGDVADKKISLKKGGSAVWFVVPTDGTADKLAELAGNHVTGSSVSYSLDGDVVTTTLTYAAEGGTVFAIRAAPGQGSGQGHRHRPRHLPEHLRHAEGGVGQRAHLHRAAVGADLRPRPEQAEQGREVRARRAGQQGHRGHQGVAGRHLLRRQEAVPRGDAVPARPAAGARRTGEADERRSSPSS